MRTRINIISARATPKLPKDYLGDPGVYKSPREISGLRKAIKRARLTPEYERVGSPMRLRDICGAACVPLKTGRKASRLKKIRGIGVTLLHF